MPAKTGRYFTNSLIMQPEKSKLLLIEPSSTMRFVLENFVAEQGYEAESHDNFRQGAASLREQFGSFDDEYACVLFGWPSARDADAAKFVAMLESVDFHDLPVVVLSQEMRADSRAWVAGRDRTVLLRWKDYRSVKSRLSSLLDKTLDGAANAVNAKFSNDDIRILVVDDSASIRFALRDLLQLQGYDVTVVSNHDEAMSAAISSSFDIAVLDYYLQDSTGDDLCRDLLESSETGELTCAILTGTYSDHIIKSSLRAGAIECMFKNESSELLLARIDAISRLVRQRKVLLQEHRKMDSVIDSMGGCVLVFDLDGKVVFANESGKQSLGHKEDISLIGRSVVDVVSEELPGAERGEKQRGVFLNQRQENIGVVYRCSDLKLNGKRDGTIVVFRTVDEVLSGDEAALSNDLPSIDSLRQLLDEKLLAGSAAEDMSLLLIEINFRNSSNELKTLAEDPARYRLVSAALASLYPYDGELAFFPDGRVAVLLHHQQEQEALMQTRKLMQICNELGEDAGLQSVSCIGSLAGLHEQSAAVGDADRTGNDLLKLVEEGLVEAGGNGRNTCYISLYDRHMPVYPAPVAQPA